MTANTGTFTAKDLRLSAAFVKVPPLKAFDISLPREAKIPVNTPAFLPVLVTVYKLPFSVTLKFGFCAIAASICD